MEKDEKTSILISFYPGVEAGNAIADILFGDINPSGHLTDTWASKIEDYPTTSSFIESDSYVRYKEDISQWYDCMHKYKLTDDEIKIMEDHLLSVYGSASMQEEIMKLSMDERITGYSMKEANSLRKLIAKKKIHLQAQAKEEFYKNAKFERRKAEKPVRRRK